MLSDGFNITFYVKKTLIKIVTSRFKTYTNSIIYGKSEFTWCGSQNQVNAATLIVDISSIREMVTNNQIQAISIKIDRQVSDVQVSDVQVTSYILCFTKIHTNCKYSPYNHLSINHLFLLPICTYHNYISKNKNEYIGYDLHIFIVARIKILKKYFKTTGQYFH